jgi:hypothetical protein
MPLLDHFRPPLRPGRHWESFHTLWAAEIAAALNRSVLPPGYFAEAQIQLGSAVEVDVATLEESERLTGGNGAATAVAAELWAPPAPPIVFPALFPDEFAVRVFGGPTGPHLVAAVELVSPRNKDRPEARRAFASKCASYLHAGVGLVVVDVVTERTANLHDELTRVLELPEQFAFPGGAALYAAAYRPVRRPETGDQIELWPQPLTVGEPLPVLPLALRGAVTVPVDLEATYSEARQRSRL